VNGGSSPASSPTRGNEPAHRILPAPQAVPLDPLAGTPYRVLAPLGGGAMGEILEAEHLELGKRVVVKLLRAELAGDPTLVERMRLEAQTAARLAHPNLVAVTDCGHTQDRRPYFVMERLHGSTLREELNRRGALSVPEAIDVVRQVLAGLQIVHEAGLVHRDVKLDNLFLCTPVDGRRHVKVLDFGIAKVVVRHRSELTPAPIAVPTADGYVLGTPRYAAPEQARGSVVDARTDVYSTGIVLYWLLTGCDPFAHHRGARELVWAHVSELPEPPSRRSSRPIPAALDAAVLRALEKRPGDRFPSAAAFAAELAAIAAAPGVTEAPARAHAPAPALRLSDEVPTRIAPQTPISKGQPGFSGRPIGLFIVAIVCVMLTLLVLTSMQGARTTP
jgi:eukaryotic-like serine/threonine-protein kinase